MKIKHEHIRMAMNAWAYLVITRRRNTSLQQTTEHNLSRVPEERSYAACTGFLSG